jgi:hypothetical protein
VALAQHHRVLLRDLDVHAGLEELGKGGVDGVNMLASGFVPEAAGPASTLRTNRHVDVREGLEQLAKDGVDGVNMLAAVMGLEAAGPASTLRENRHVDGLVGRRVGGLIAAAASVASVGRGSQVWVRP